MSVGGLVCQTRATINKLIINNPITDQDAPRQVFCVKEVQETPLDLLQHAAILFTHWKLSKN